MNTLIVAFIIVLLIISIWLNVVVIRKNLSLSDQREELVDTIEDSLDILDECYGRMSRHASTDVFSDEPIVKEVISDIKYARHAILAVANKVVTYGSDNDEDETQ